MGLLDRPAFITKRNPKRAVDSNMALDATIWLPDDPAMDTAAITPPITMTRRNQDLNMARFYRLWLEPTLFGEVCLARNWGRISTYRQVKIETFGQACDAAAALEKCAKAKVRRGYR